MSAPIANEGSAPQARSATVAMALVVVLPLAPATASPDRSAMSMASACERCSTGRPRRRTSTSSGLSSWMAEEITTTASSGTSATLAGE
ncbi:hypothetical protein [Barrientosiimonas endolithica]